MHRINYENMVHNTREDFKKKKNTKQRNEDCKKSFKKLQKSEGDINLVVTPFL